MLTHTESTSGGASAGDICHHPHSVDGILEQMDKARMLGEKLEKTLVNLSDEIDGNFSGKASKSLITLLDNEINKIKLAKENWQTLYDETKQIAVGIEEQDKALIK